jgi:hypothetical protein
MADLNAWQILEYVRFGVILFDAALIFLLFYALWKALRLRPRFKADPNIKPVMTIKKAELLEKWQVLNEKFREGKPDSLKVAVIQGDALVDTVLKTAGLPGEHMADRLDNIEPGELASFEDIWRSHKIRNQIVHEENFELTREAAEKALRGYEKFLKEIKVIE